jgi:probable phosphoglycerate mutase
MQILFLRHGITDWNIQKRLQGRADIPLAGVGREQVSNWVIPDGVNQWYVSPLQRTRETAELLGLDNFRNCPELIEMNWGEWEGETLGALRKQISSEMAVNESRGLDMRPPAGESPREVRERVHRWVISLSPQDYIGAITHKGVIRAAISLATGWDMKSKYRINVRNDFGYLFSWKSGELVFENDLSLT